MTADQLISFHECCKQIGLIRGQKLTELEEICLYELANGIGGGLLSVEDFIVFLLKRPLLASNDRVTDFQFDEGSCPQGGSANDDFYDWA